MTKVIQSVYKHNIISERRSRSKLSLTTVQLQHFTKLYHAKLCPIQPKTWSNAGPPRDEANHNFFKKKITVSNEKKFLAPYQTSKQLNTRTYHIFKKQSYISASCKWNTNTAFQNKTIHKLHITTEEMLAYAHHA